MAYKTSWLFHAFFLSLVAIPVFGMGQTTQTENHAVAQTHVVAQTAPEGFTALFNGEDLSGWAAMETDNPRTFAALSAEEQEAAFKAAAEATKKFWRVENGDIVNDGKGPYLTTLKNFRDFELLIQYKTVAKADSGIYLKATPQVQIWDFTDEAKFKLGADKGSGGLWNQAPGSPGKNPLVLADKPFGQWNQFRIRQIGSRTSVWLNDQLVVDHVLMQNRHWSRKMKLPLIAEGPIQLQTHGGEIRWRNIFIKEFTTKQANEILASRATDGFKSIFNGKDLSNWDGAVDSYEVIDGGIRCKPGTSGTVYTQQQFSDFAARLEFKLPSGGNNGLAIRYPGAGQKDTAYHGMCELQVLDDVHKKFAGKLDSRQYHGSAYGMVAAHQGYLRPAGQWNFQELTVVGSTIKVELNGTLILDCDLATVTEYLDEKPHPGKDRTEGHFGFAGHGDPVEFRNLSIKTLQKPTEQ